MERWGTTRAFTLGVEEELLLVDRDTHQLANESEAVLARLGLDDGAAHHDLYAALIEIATPICRDAPEAADALGHLRRAIRRAGATPMGVGIHPDARFGELEIVPVPRYQAASASMRGLMRRTPECALHVHVGVPDPETAVRVLNGMRGHLPVLQALAANSPFWYGRDSGLASARMAAIREYPRTGIPRAFASYEDWAETVAAIRAAGELDDYTFLWWDVRLHPRLGTVEVRSMDSQAALSTTAGIAALVQALARHEAERLPTAPAPREALAETSFRASRDGLAATLWHEDALRPAVEVAGATIELARPHARALGSEAALDELAPVLAGGGGADRQRRAHARGGMDALLRLLVDETAGA